MPDNNLESALAAAEASSFVNAGKTLVIDNDLRTIKVPNNFVFGVYNDKDVLSVPFEMPRHYDDLDLGEFTIAVNYLNANGSGNRYEVPDKVIGEDKITFEWLLGSGVFVKEGTIKFSVCLRLYAQDQITIEKEFNTTIATGPVLQGLEVESTEDPEQYSLLARMEALKNEALGYARESSNAADEAVNSNAEVKTLISKYGSPLKASTIAGMTDITKVYVYTGSETGYTAGNWYYFDSGNWVSGGVYNSVAVSTDKTLTLEDEAADAKAVGDELTDLKSDLNEGKFPMAAKSALLDCLAHVAWTDEHGQEYYDALEQALDAGVQSISATFTQGGYIFTPTDELDDLRAFLVVTAVFTDHTETVSGYTLTGNLNTASSTILVQYGGKTTSFSVAVTLPPAGYTVKNYVTTDGTQYITTDVSEPDMEDKWTRAKISVSQLLDRAGHIFSSLNYFSPYARYFPNTGLRNTSFNWFGSQAYTALSEGNQWNLDEPFTIESFKNGVIVEVDGVAVKSCVEGSTMDSSKKLALFTYGGNPTSTYYRFYGNFYYYKIFNADGTKAHDFIPCVNSSNVVGIYDLIAGTFYAPTAGTLIAG